MRILIFFISFFVFKICYCQKITPNNNIQLIYPKTTIEAKKEIKNHLLLNPQKKEYFKSIIDSNYILLTEKQFLPVKKYIENYNENENYKEFLIFKKKGFLKYYNIEKLINE